MTSVLLLLLVSGHPASVAAWQQAQPSAVVSGVLVAADNGQPVRNADVRLVSTSPRMTRTTTSDGEGRWEFDALPAGEYALSASRQGYLDMVYGARSPGASRRGTPLLIASGQRIDDISFALPRAAVITGIVTDEYGDPAYRVSVQALRYAYQNGQRIVRSAGSATTDDLGAYRIPFLAPGEYLVTAVPRETVASLGARAEMLQRMQAERAAAAQGGDREARAAVATMAEARREGRTAPPVDPVGYVPLYYPGTVLPAAAAAVRVGVGGQVHGIDIRLERVETARISGTVLSADGQPIQGNLKLIDPAMPVSPIGAWFTSSGPDGRFTFFGVVPGTYVVGGNNSPPGTIGGPPESGGVFQMAEPVKVVATGGDVDGIEVRMVPANSVSGRVDLDSLTVPINRDELRVNFFPVTMPADWEMPLYRAVPEPDGSFVIPDLIAGRYRIDVAGAPDGWMLGSAMFNNRDAADHHLTIEPAGRYENGVFTLTNRTGSVRGVVTDAQQAPREGYTLVLFPADPALRLPRSRRIRTAESGADGRYVIEALPAGEYRLAVVLDLEPDQQFDVAYLAELARASVSVELVAGQPTVQDIRVGR